MHKYHWNTYLFKVNTYFSHTYIRGTLRSLISWKSLDWQVLMTKSNLVNLQGLLFSTKQGIEENLSIFVIMIQTVDSLRII